MQPQKKLSRAFTLTEVLMVVTIFGFVMAGILPFFVSNLRSQFVAEQKLLINGDIRKATNSVMENAREANSFVMYQAFASSQTRWDGASESRDLNGNGAVTFTDRISNGGSGDFMVLVYYTDPFFDALLYDGNLTNNPPIGTGSKATVVKRMIGYWVAPNRRFPGENALYLFDTDSYKASPTATTWTTSWNITFPATLSATTSIESLLPPATVAESTAAQFPIILNDVRGISDNYVFYNYNNVSIITRAKILHGNQAKRVTNTYNFTITPRG